jgi:hypothetical protein
MLRKDKEITDKKIIDEILNKSQICRIAFFDVEFPYIVPFNYGYLDNALYFHSAANGKKIDLIRKNNKVCFEIEYFSQITVHELPCEWTTKYRSVIGSGNIDIITGFEEKKKGLDIIMAHYGSIKNNVYNTNNIDNIVILKLNITGLSAKQSGNWDNESKPHLT